MPITTKPRATKSRPAKSRPAKDSYHHGNLRQVLIDTTLKLISKVRPENVTVRAVAKLAGVSSGAPFRHFPDRAALMTAVAEEAILRLQEEVATSLNKAADKNPLLRFRAIGEAWIRLPVLHPYHFKAISDRSLIDSDASAAWRRQSEDTRATSYGDGDHMRVMAIGTACTLLPRRRDSVWPKEENHPMRLGCSIAKLSQRVASASFLARSRSSSSLVTWPRSSIIQTC